MAYLLASLLPAWLADSAGLSGWQTVNQLQQTTERESMEFFWFLAGAVAVWFIITFRSTKRRAQEAAAQELAQFLEALREWGHDRDDFDKQMKALHHYEDFNLRYSDYLADTTGRSLPATRAVLAANFVMHMRDMGLVGHDGRPSHRSGSAAVFWKACEDLRALRDDLLQNTPFADILHDAVPPSAPTASNREHDRARLVQAMRQT